MKTAICQLIGIPLSKVYQQVDLQSGLGIAIQWNSFQDFVPVS